MPQRRRTEKAMQGSGGGAAGRARRPPGAAARANLPSPREKSAPDATSDGRAGLLDRRSVAAGGTAEREGNLSELAYEKLSRMILQRQLPGGTLVIEGRMADELEISRTPMREALVRLAGEGLLVRQATRSFSVRRVTPTEFFQSMKVREILEAEAIGLALGKVSPQRIESIVQEVERLSVAAKQETAHWTADDHVHQMFAEAGGNAVLAKLIREVRINTRLFEISRPFRRVREDAAEHLDILVAFARGDLKATRKAMLRHLRNLQAEVMAIISGHVAP